MTVLLVLLCLSLKGRELPQCVSSWPHQEDEHITDSKYPGEAVGTHSLGFET